MAVTEAVGLKPVMRIRMTREAYTRLSFAVEMGERLHAWPTSTYLSHWFHKQSTTTRDNLYGVQIWGIRATRRLI